MKTIWNILQKEYRSFETQREKVLELSTTIRRMSKLLIHKQVHHVNTEVEEDIKKVKIHVLALLRLLEKKPNLYVVGAAAEGLEEYCELVFFEAYRAKDENILKHIPPAMPHEAIIGGIADMSGEIIRIVRTAMNSETAQNAYSYLTDIYSRFLELEVSRNNKLRAKMEDTRRNLIRLEEIIFSLKLREKT